jgi:hypothetical protein
MGWSIRTVYYYMQPQHINISQVTFTKHFEERLQERFKMTVEELKTQFNYFKVANNQCKFRTIQVKISREPNMKYFYHERLNMMFPVCPRTKTAITTMFIDNKDWVSVKY